MQLSTFWDKFLACTERLGNENIKHAADGMRQVYIKMVEATKLKKLLLGNQLKPSMIHVHHFDQRAGQWNCLCNIPWIVTDIEDPSRGHSIDHRNDAAGIELLACSW